VVVVRIVSQSQWKGFTPAGRTLAHCTEYFLEEGVPSFALEADRASSFFSLLGAEEGVLITHVEFSRDF